MVQIGRSEKWKYRFGTDYTNLSEMVQVNPGKLCPNGRTWTKLSPSTMAVQDIVSCPFFMQDPDAQHPSSSPGSAPCVLYILETISPEHAYIKSPRRRVPRSSFTATPACSQTQTRIIFITALGDSTEATLQEFHGVFVLPQPSRLIPCPLAYRDLTLCWKFACDTVTKQKQFF